MKGNKKKQTKANPSVSKSRNTNKGDVSDPREGVTFAKTAKNEERWGYIDAREDRTGRA